MLTVLIVAELKHQLVTSLRMLLVTKAALLDAIGEAEIRQRWRHDVERWSFASVLLGEQWQQLRHFQETARPCTLSDVWDVKSVGWINPQPCTKSRGMALELSLFWWRK